MLGRFTTTYVKIFKSTSKTVTFFFFSVLVMKTLELI